MTDAPHRPLGFRFWLIALAAAVAMAATASLGRWQLARAAQKQAYQATLDTRGQLPALAAVEALAIAGEPGAPPLPAEHPALHRPVVLEGRWLPEHTVYLDNRQMGGRPGFYVVTPLQLDAPGRAAVVLVQRGWAARNFQDRLQLPPVRTPEGRVRVEGRMAAAPARLYEFDGGPAAQGSSRIRQNLDLTVLAAETALGLTPWTVQETGAASDGLQRDWPVVGAGVDKHYGYAFQWFGLCGLVALLYVWFQIVPRFFRPRRQPAA